MTSPKFVTANKWLTQYALACGYLEVSKGYNTPGCRLRACMEMDSACYHVKVSSDEHGRELWDTYDSLPEARKAFCKVLRDYGLQRKIPVQPRN